MDHPRGGRHRHPHHRRLAAPGRQGLPLRWRAQGRRRQRHLRRRQPQLRRGDAYAGLFKVSSGVDVSWRGLGLAVSGRAWYDTVLKDGDVPQGDVANGFAPDAPLSDRGFSRSNRFSGVMLLDAYVYARHDLGATAHWDARVGRQRLKWGEGLFFNGLNQVSPTDFTTLHRPGTDPASEAQLPVEMVWNRLAFDNGFSIEGFYQWKWRAAELDPCGTFWSGTDIGIDPGCAGLQSNAYYPINASYAGTGQWLSDGYMNAAGAYLPRGTDLPAKDRGQFGVALHYRADALNTDFGLYFTRYNARLPILNATTPDSALTQPDLTARLVAAGVPLTYAQLSTRLSTITESWEYPNGIRLMGLSAATRWKQWKFGSEISYTDNLPVQLNTADMFAALTRNGGPIGDRTLGQPEGFLLRGYDRFQKMQLQANATRTFGPRWGAQGGVLAGEVAWQHVNLPSVTVARYGRGFAWGYSPQGFDGSCAAVQNPDGCVNDGYFTRVAWGYRLRGQLNYAVGHATLSPSLTWAHDVRGYSVDSALVQHRRAVTVGVAGKFAPRYFASLGYTRYLGDNRYDVLADHDNLTAAVGATF
ncbi:DUF1302 domain-containing protein [Xanthomonas sp. Kuri4-2]